MTQDLLPRVPSRVRRNFQTIAVLAAFMFGLLFAGRMAAGQSATGGMTITVTDSTGAVIPNAKIVVTGTDTGAVVRQITSNEAGIAEVPLLQPGRYTATITAAGFASFVRAGVDVSVGDTVGLTLALKLGAETEVVTVTGAGPLLETKTDTIAQLVPAKEATDLPLNGRNYLSIANLIPGAVPTVQGRDQSFNAFGNSGLQNAFLLDGVRNVDYIRGLPTNQRDSIRPPLDAIHEFTVQTSNFSAEFGASAGAVVNVITNSGSDRVHGSGYDFIQNNYADATNYFALSPPMKVYNQYGGSLGGPLLRKRVWLFGAYEGFHNRSSSVTTSTVPTALERMGDFSQSIVAATKKPVLIYDPNTTAGTGTTATRAQFVSNGVANVIPQARLDPLGLALANEYPLPNNPAVGPNAYQRLAPSLTQNENGILRGDVQISSKDSAFARYTYARQSTDSQIVFAPPVDNDGDQLILTSGVGAGYTRVFNSTLVDEVRFGYTSIEVIQAGTQPRNEVIPGSLDPLVTTGTPNFNVSNFGGLGAQTITNNPADKSSSVYDFADNVSKTLGRHALRIGGELLLIRPTTFATGNGRASIGFTGVFSQLPSARGTTGSALADLLLGDGNSITTGTTSKSIERGFFVGGYIADQWSVTPDLTLNVGGRYEYAAPYIETSNHMANLVLDAGSPLYGQYIFAGDPRLPRGLIYGDKNNVAPRVGLAYRVPGVNQMSIRSSFGIFYAQDEGTGVQSRMTDNPPFYGYGGVTITSNQLQPSTGFLLSTPSITRAPAIPASAFTLVPSSTTALVSWPEHLRTGYVEEWSLSVEKQLGRGILAEVNYVGNHGVELTSKQERNQPMILNNTTVASRRPLFLAAVPITDASVTEIGDANGSNYNGVTFKLEKRFDKGLSFLSALSFGHEHDLQNEGGDLISGDTTSDIIQNNYNIAAQYSNGDNDGHLRYVLSGIYELPFGPGKPFLHAGFMSLLLGGFAVSPVYQYATSPNVNPELSFDAANAGTVTRPTEVCNPNVGGAGTRTSYFNTGCLIVGPSYTFGNAGRNSIVQPPIDQLNVSLQRAFSFERFLNSKLNLRLESFNVLNHPQFGGLNTTVNAALYGQLTTAAAPRILQVAARLTF